jgi:hypothetical protein
MDPNNIQNEIKKQKLNLFIASLMSIIDKYKQVNKDCTYARLVGFVDNLLHSNFTIKLTKEELENEHFLEAKMIIEKNVNDQDLLKTELIGILESIKFDMLIAITQAKK